MAAVRASKTSRPHYRVRAVRRTPFTVEITPEVTGALSEEIAAVRAEQQEVAIRPAEVAARARAVARRLRAAGLTGSEVGAVMGVSEQRASQLLKDAG
jgi:DNA-directed RNA polymerase specialized sigma subunit